MSQRITGRQISPQTLTGTAPVQIFVVISYDIPDTKRRNKVCKLLKDYGARVQYSVFECQIRPGDLRRLRERLRPLLNLDEDDVRFYQLCAHCLPKARVWSQRERVPPPDAVLI